MKSDQYNFDRLPKLINKKTDPERYVSSIIMLIVTKQNSKNNAFYYINKEEDNLLYLNNPYG